MSAKASWHRNYVTVTLCIPKVTFHKYFLLLRKQLFGRIITLLLKLFEQSQAVRPV